MDQRSPLPAEVPAGLLGSKAASSQFSSTDSQLTRNNSPECEFELQRETRGAEQGASPYGNSQF